MTDGYAFSKGVLCELDVICNIGEELTLTPVIDLKPKLVIDLKAKIE
jgi:hypothetical protein